MERLIERVGDIINKAQIHEQPLTDFVTKHEKILDELISRYDKIFGEPEQKPDDDGKYNFVLI